MNSAADSALEWIRGMRLQLLESLIELSSVHLQEAWWTTKDGKNPHYTFLEFVASSQLSTTQELAFQLSRGVVTKKEYDALLPLVAALSTYTPPDGDWYASAQVLRDPNWKYVTDQANASLCKFLICTLNSESNLADLVQTHLASSSAA
jgi:hypothetical protein